MGSSSEAPIRFLPEFVAKPWGGGALLRAFGLPVPNKPPTGEVWLLSDVPGRSSTITAGRGAGKPLEQLLRADARFVLGRAEAPAGRFPLLVKLLEVQGKLSLQVHPDRQQASRAGDGPSGKFEAWSVLATSSEARVTFGFERPLSADEVRALIAQNRLEEALNSFAPAVGDAYVLSPGTVHAAAGGVLFLEVQETADVTYRLYDWGTVGLDGEPRELHLDKALAVADLAPRTPRRPEAASPRSRGTGSRARTIVAPGTGPFVYELAELEANGRLPLGGDERPWVVVGVGGRVELAGSTIAPGEAVLWPAGAGAAELSAHAAATCALAAPTLA